MTKARKVAWIVVGLVVVGAIGASIYLYVRQNEPERVLSRARLALRANNFARAATLADDYIARRPRDWQGYALRAQVFMNQGKFEEARAPLIEACRLNKADPALAIALAGTYSNAAIKALGSLAAADNARKVELLRGAAAGFGKANEILSAFKAADPTVNLDVDQHAAINEYHIAKSLATISDVLAKDAALAEASRNSELATARRERSIYEWNQALKSFDKAIAHLLEVILKDPSRDEPAEMLVTYCLAHQDPNSFRYPGATNLAMASKAATALDLARKAIQDPNLKNPPVNASVQLARDELRSCPSGDAERITQISRRLDGIIAANPGNTRARITRAKAAHAADDNVTAMRLVEEVIKVQPQYPEARLLQARLMLSSADKCQDPNDAKALVAAAEKQLYGLKSQLHPADPWFAEAYYLYALVADRAGKKELANEALRTVAQVEQDASAGRRPGESARGHFALDAQKHFARRLLNQGFAEQAFSYAEPYYRRRPDDPEALGLFVQAARQTGQKDPARNALMNAWKGKPGPVMLMVVVEGLASLGMPAEADAALNDMIERAKANPPKTTEEALAVARGFLLKQRTAEAEELLNSMLAKMPNDPRVCFALTKLYGTTNRQMQAEELCRRAVTLDGREPSYRLALAEMLVHIGNLDEALEVLAPAVCDNIQARLLQLRIHALRLRQIEAEARARQSDTEATARGIAAEAREQIEAEARALLRQTQGEQRYAAPLAQVYLAANNPKRCVQICQAGLKDNPGDPALLETLALAYGALKDDANSINTWKAVIQAQPQSLPAYQQFATLLVESAVGDSTTRPARTVRLSAQQVDDAVTAARTELAALPGARQDMVDLAVADLYEKAKMFGRQAEFLAKVAANPIVTQQVKYEAQLGRASALARAGKVEEAVKLLDSLIGVNEGRAKARVLFAKAVLLAADENRKAEAADTLAELCEQAKDANDPDSLRQAAALQARLGQTDKALETCQEAQRLCPDDPRAYLVQADILASNGRLQQVPDLLRKAIELQPGNLSLYSLLANALDALGQPVAALKALEETQRLGQAGESFGLLQQGTLLAKWGLQAQAIQRFEKLSDTVTEPWPQLQLALADSFRRMGRAELARQALARISEYADEYAQAQLRLADLAETAEAKLEIVRDLAKRKPGDESAIRYELALFVGEKRPAEALEALETYRASDKPRRPIPARAVSLAVTAAVQTGNKDNLTEIGRELAETADSPQTRLAAALLLMDEPDRAAKLLAGTSQASVYPIMLQLCLAATAQDANAARQCAETLTKIGSFLGKLQPPQRIPAAHMFLCGLLAQDEAMTNAAMARLSTGRIAPAAKELLSAWALPAKPREETVKLLKAALAREVTLPALSRALAIEVLKDRPTCQWAAAELALAGPDPEQIEWVVETLRPADCRLARTMRANLLLQKKQYKQAAEVYAALNKDDPKPDPDCLEKQAMALEADGRLTEALNIYRQVWQASGSPVSANNAACIVIQLSPKDSSRLAEAKQWTDAAMKAMPLPALADTAGWIAHLQGRDADALALLRRAIQGLPDSPEVHCHLGVVESAAGDPELGRWHLEAAVEIGNDLKAAGKPISQATAEAIERARQELSAVAKPQRASK